MVGAGAVVFAVMGYVISRQQPPDFTVELNPKLLAAILGETPEAIEKAIDYLQSPDPISRTEEKDGRRLEKVGSFNYHVVNGAKYHSIRNYEERKAYNREAQRKFREKHSKPGDNTATGNTPPPELPPATKPPKRIPDLEEVLLVAAKTGLSEVEARKFFSYYASNGWKVGKNPMKSWQHALSGWKTRSEQYSNPSSNGHTPPKDGLPRLASGEFDYSRMTDKQKSEAVRIENA